MADLFPIGTMANSSSSGTIDSKSYTFFEPNMGSKTTSSYNTLISTFEQKTILTRKKAEPVVIIVYSYNNILTSEYRTLGHFIDVVAEDGLNSFYVVSFDRGTTPTSIALSGSNWIVSMPDTRYYSATANTKANAAFLTDGVNWKAGAISALTANTSVTVELTVAPYGNLSLANAQLNANIYPIYECYLSPNQLSGFEKTAYIDGKINASSDGGFLFQGELSFVGRYKV